MYRLERSEFVRTPFLALWTALGFQAGFINAFGFLACARFVSHVTGIGTQMGVAVAEKQLLFALELLGMPIFFILGSAFNAFFTIARIERGKKPYYGFVTFVIPFTLLLVCLMGISGNFGPFGEALIFARDFVLLFSLAFVCGMQNGCFATMTKGQIRTTHLTGISTDLGTDLVRSVFGKLNPEELGLTKRTQYSRALTFVGFTVGSVLSVIISAQLNYAALLVPVFTGFLICLAVRRVHVYFDRKFAQDALPSQTKPVSAVATKPPRRNRASIASRAGNGPVISE